MSHPGVDSPAFTTALSQICMAAPEYAFNLINKTVGSRWKEFIDKTTVLFDDAAMYHPAYDGYSPSMINDSFLHGSFPIMTTSI